MAITFVSRCCAPCHHGQRRLRRSLWKDKQGVPPYRRTNVAAVSWRSAPTGKSISTRFRACATVMSLPIQPAPATSSDPNRRARPGCPMAIRLMNFSASSPGVRLSVTRHVIPRNSPDLDRRAERPGITPRNTRAPAASGSTAPRLVAAASSRFVGRTTPSSPVNPRGKLWRTKLAKTEAGYVAMSATHRKRSPPHGRLRDLSAGRSGDLLPHRFAGLGQWTEGEGRLFKVSFDQKEAASPVLTWPDSETGPVIEFDHPVEPPKTITIDSGRYVAAADRLEVMRPGYAVVRMQQSQVRTKVPVVSVSANLASRSPLNHFGTPHRGAELRHRPRRQLRRGS